jgi:hypothetical protein
VDHLIALEGISELPDAENKLIDQPNGLPMVLVWVFWDVSC